MNRQPLPYEQDTMQMVGHHLHRLHFYLRIVTRYPHPFGTHRPPQLRKHDMRGFTAEGRRRDIALESTEERIAALHLDGNHIHTPFEIVVMIITALHRLTLFSKMLFFPNNPMFFHSDGKGTKKNEECDEKQSEKTRRTTKNKRNGEKTSETQVNGER